MTTLFAHGAERIYANSSEAAVQCDPFGGHAGGPPHGIRVARADPLSSSTEGRPSDTGGTESGVHAPPCLSEEDEDPFGYNVLGFDEPFVGHRRELDNPVGVTRPAVVGETQQPSGAHRSHSLRRTGNIVWCDVCGRHAAIRLGIGLIKPCRGEATGGYPTRIARLKRGQHPVSGILA